jgi:hypothetical protein
LLLGLPPAGAEDISLRETADAFPRSLLASLRGLLGAIRTLAPEISSAPVG